MAISDIHEKVMMHGEIVDVEELSKMHCEIFSSNRNITALLGQNYLKAVYTWFIESPESYVLVTKIDNHIAAWAVVCDSSYNRKLLKNTFTPAVFGFLMHLKSIWHPEMSNRIWGLLMNRPIAGETISDPPDLAYLAYIAVNPLFRHRRLGSEILKSAIDISRKRGSQFMRAGIYKDNISSIRLFVGCGFKILSVPRTKSLLYVQADLGKI